MADENKTILRITISMDTFQSGVAATDKLHLERTYSFPELDLQAIARIIEAFDYTAKKLRDTVPVK